MSSAEDTEVYAPSVPSILDLVRMSPKRLFPPGGVDLYRQIAVLTEMAPGVEVLDVAAGNGVPLEYFATEFGVTASGVDVNPEMVSEAEWWSRERQQGQRMQFQSGRSDALPYRDDIFDTTIGEIGFSNHCEPAHAIRELVRVTKPGGFVVLVQLVWKAPIDASRREVLSAHLGARPLMVVEWKRLLKECGVGEVHIEDWSDDETAFRPAVVKPFSDFAEMFSLGERIGILRRVWRRWGWRGVSSAIARGNEVHKLLTSERILGLDLLRGRKEGGRVTESSAEVSDSETSDTVESPESVATLPHPADPDSSQSENEESEMADTHGLPLFQGEPEGETDE
jgi:ubiquinone/menaquinone biosynthesis C-methylase UbiE